MPHFSRETTTTSFSISIDDINEEGATGGAPLPDDDDDGRSAAAADQPQPQPDTPTDGPADSRPTTSVTAAPSRPVSSAPQNDLKPKPAQADDDDDGNSPESIKAILENKLKRKLSSK